MVTFKSNNQGCPRMMCPTSFEMTSHHILSLYSKNWIGTSQCSLTLFDSYRRRIDVGDAIWLRVKSWFQPNTGYSSHQNCIDAATTVYNNFTAVIINFNVSVEDGITTPIIDILGLCKSTTYDTDLGVYGVKGRVWIQSKKVSSLSFKSSNSFSLGS